MIFSKEQEQWIRDNAQGIGNIELTNRFNAKFGENREMRQIRAWKKNNKVSSGLTGWFEKGRQDPHKGDHTFRIKNSGHTQFKKGNRPKNYLPVGTTVKDTEGYYKTKVADPNKWKLTHRVIWEKVHGPIPKGYTVTFLDKNKENLDPNNLALLSRRAQAIAQNVIGLSSDSSISKSVINLSELIAKRNKLQKDLNKRRRHGK